MLHGKKFDKTNIDFLKCIEQLSTIEENIQLDRLLRSLGNTIDDEENGQNNNNQEIYESLGDENSPQHMQTKTVKNVKPTEGAYTT